MVMLKKIAGGLLFFSFFLLPFENCAAERGGIVEAIYVARDEFINRLPKKHVAKNSHGDYMRNIDSYNIGVSQNEVYYVVVFLVRDKNVSGGGGEYLIRKKDMKIEKFSGYF